MQFSYEALWERIEEVYGSVPHVIKQILYVNGFDSYLALKGIRYDNKNEFFEMLERTVTETVTSEYESDEKSNMINSLVGYNAKNFKIKPGHRNLIMNLMLEIDRTDVNEFFKHRQQVVDDAFEIPLAKSPSEIKFEIQDEDEDHQSIEEERFMYAHDQHTTENIEKDEAAGSDMSMEQFMLEEYLSDENIAIEVENYIMPKRHAKRNQPKPTQMYNEEFLAQKINPRRRRVTTARAYPNTDEGKTERFRDLMQQSMECILPKETFSMISHATIDIEKENDFRWNVTCPLCSVKIKLAIKLEKKGYYNYKRSNFERHLRFKHCKEPVHSGIAYVYQKN